MPSDSRDTIFSVAQLHDGYFTAFEAKEVGINSKSLVGFVKRGTLEHPSRGVYRLKRYPEMSPNAYLWTFVLWPKAHGDVPVALSHKTALRLHELSDVNPSETHVTVLKTFRVRRDLPSQLKLHRADLPDYDIEWVDGLPVTTVDRTLRDIAESGDSVVLRDALRDARAKNLQIPRELINV